MQYGNRIPTELKKACLESRIAAEAKTGHYIVSLHFDMLGPNDGDHNVYNVGDVLDAKVVGALPGFEDGAKVLYVGSEETDEKGCLYGESLSTGHRDWIQVSELRQDRLARVVDTNDLSGAAAGTPIQEVGVSESSGAVNDSCAADFSDAVVVDSIAIGSQIRISENVPSVMDGYLAVAAGDIVEVLYVGSEAQGDAEFIYGRSVSKDEQGWLSADAGVPQDSEQSQLSTDPEWTNSGDEPHSGAHKEGNNFEEPRILPQECQNYGENLLEKVLRDDNTADSVRGSEELSADNTPPVAAAEPQDVEPPAPRQLSACVIPPPPAGPPPVVAAPPTTKKLECRSKVASQESTQNLGISSESHTASSHISPGQHAEGDAQAHTEATVPTAEKTEKEEPSPPDASTTKDAAQAQPSKEDTLHSGSTPAAFSDARLGRSVKVEPRRLNGQTGSAGARSKAAATPPSSAAPRPPIDPNGPLHRKTNEELQDIARDMGMPDVDSLKRVHLTSNIEEARKWQALTLEELQNKARTLGVTFSQGETKASLLKTVIMQVYDKTATPSAPSGTTTGSSPTSGSPAAASSTTAATPAEPTVAAPVAAPLPKVNERLPRDLPPDEALAAEVRRINACRDSDYRSILELDKAANVDTAKSHYRQIMRLLHPDKRTSVGEELAGGKDPCDQAMQKVQASLKQAELGIGSKAPVAATVPRPAPQWQHPQPAAQRQTFPAAPNPQDATSRSAPVRRPMPAAEKPVQNWKHGPWEDTYITPRPLPNMGIRRLIVCD